MLRHLDLFSGIGAFSLAARRAGLMTTYFSEINPYANRVLAKNFPRVPNLGDIHQIEGDWLADFIGVDLITGGFPCTDLSQASYGSHQGLDGQESGLFWEMARVIWEVDPRWVIIENVPQVLKFRQTIEDEFPFLEFEGGIFEAGDYGANCRRKRAFLIGCSELGGARKVLDLIQGYREAFQSRGDGDVFPMCLPWKGGVSLERLGSCVVELADPEADSTRIRTGDGVRAGLDRSDGARYLALGNSIVPRIPELIMKAIVEVEEGGFDFDEVETSSQLDNGQLALSF